MFPIKVSNLNKKLILISSDLIIIIFSLNISFSLRLEKIYNIWDIDIKIYLLYIIVFFSVFYVKNIYQVLLRYFDYFSIIKVLKSILICSLILIPLNFLLYETVYFPRSISFIAPIVIGLLILSHRVFINFLINLDKNKENKINNILIFGINENSISIINNLRNVPGYGIVKSLIDTSNEYKKRELNGIKISKVENFLKIIDKKNITEIIISYKSLNKNQIQNLYDNLNDKNIRIRNLVNIKKNFFKEINRSLETNINFYDIINRPKIEVDKKLLSKKIYNKTILVTGGGGSIGSELCVEIIKHNPKRIFILDISEINLYNTALKLKKYNQKKIQLVLGDCNNPMFLKNYFNDILIDEIYHAAAYKHVNFGEINPYSMVNNNVFGTKSILDFSVNKKIKDFVFISSDKAVNPESILGYTKKFGEYLVSQYFHQKSKSYKGNFTIVRFGNVIGSSGSVLPLFLKQVQNNQPLTVTHKKVKRYFMSISEAVQLVINSSHLNKNGLKIYALNMGSQINIYDIAKRIIILSGHTYRGSKNLKGDIPIKIIGMKKGEKISEEISLGKNLKKTDNVKIMICDEKFPLEDIFLRIKKLEKTMNLKIINKKVLIQNLKF